MLHISILLNFPYTTQHRHIIIVFSPSFSSSHSIFVPHVACKCYNTNGLHQQQMTLLWSIKIATTNCFPWAIEEWREKGNREFRKLQRQRLALCQRFNLQATAHKHTHTDTAAHTTHTHTHMCKQSAIITMCMLWDLWEPKETENQPTDQAAAPSTTNSTICFAKNSTTSRAGGVEEEG